MKKYSYIFIIFLSSLISNELFATHASGAELLYEHVINTPPNQYKFTLKFYRDCTGSSAATPANSAGATVTMCYNNSVAPNTILQATLTQAVVGLPVGSGCANFQTQCTDPNSTIPGFYECIYSGVVTLPTQVNNWRFWVDIVNRNGTIWNLQNAGNQSLYIETTLDNIAAQSNSSPIFTNPPISWTGLGAANINFGTFDPDGDSLSYLSVNPKNSGNGCSTIPANNIAYTVMSPPISPTNPFSCLVPFNVSPNLGQITFTPNPMNLGLMVVTIEVTEWRNGIAIGTILRDLQFAILNNNVSNPTATLNIPSIYGGNYNSNTGTIFTCATDSIHFCVDMSSINPGAILTAVDNHAIVTPGATVTYTGFGTSAVTGCFDWTPSGIDTGLHVLTITAKDSTCSATSPILLTSTIAIPIYIFPITKAFRDTSICIGDTVHLTVYGGSQFTWTVLPGGSPISTLTSLTSDNDTVWVQPTQTTSYVVSSNLNSVCNHYIDTVTITVATGPTLTISPDDTTCINATSQISVGAAPNNQLYTYSWIPTTYLSNPNVSNPFVINPQQDITYTVTVVPQGILACSSTESVDITVLKGFDVRPNDTAICIGGAIPTWGTGSPIYTYNWTPLSLQISNPNSINTIITPASIGNFIYTLNATYPGCPDSSQTVNVEVQDIPVVNAGENRQICSGDTIHLIGTYSPVNATSTILWTPGADLDDPTILEPVFDGLATPPPTGDMTLTITTSIGCKASDIVNIQVKAANFLQVDSNQTLCKNETAQLSVYGGIKYNWYPSLYVSDSTAANITVFPTSTTIFSVIAVDVEGCIDTGYAEVVVNPGAVLDLGDNVTIYPGESIELMANGNCSKFAWFPPNGLSSTVLKNQIANPTVTTKYYIDGETENGCKTKDSITVIVSPESILDIPNAFSPGSGTSVNDELKIIVRGLVTLNEYSIYNRWGNQVFTTKDLKKGWNGKFKDASQPMGTYVYYIDAVSSKGKKFIKKGNVTLFR
jgi:gliding motility-associated-like protein